MPEFRRARGRVAAGAGVLGAACLAAGAAGLLGASQPEDRRTPNATPASDGNYFLNPAFEEGAEPWFDFASPQSREWVRFELCEDEAHAGARSALLDMDSERQGYHTGIWGVVQEVAPATVPEYLSGWYRVQGWERGTAKQYLQVVVIVWRPRAMPPGVRAGNYQLAYVLGGADRPPIPVANRKFVFVEPDVPLGVIHDDEPVQDMWVPFEVNLREDFLREWGVEPRGFEYLRVLFEVRYDRRDDDDPPSRGRVYYDDLYIGDVPMSRRSPLPDEP